MADFKINVIVDPKQAQRGLKQVDRQFDAVADKADRLRQTIGRAFAFAGVGIGISQLIKLGDTFTNLQNRLRTVTDSEQELIAVTNELFEVSNRTRQSFEATTTVFARTVAATTELGLSTQETLSFVESLNQAVALSGATATEAENALIQLSQGLASGTLRGDELNSVLEQLPVVADVITKSLGITRGELRELGSDGKITADIIIDAFKESQEQLAEGFAEAVPTVGQALTVLQNNFLQVFGEIDQARGITSGLANAILNLADNLDILFDALQAVTILLGVDFARRAIPAAIAGVRALTIAIAANPIGAIAVALTVAISAIIAFSDKIKISEDSIVTLADIGVAAFQLISDGIATLVNFFGDNFGFIAEFASEVFDNFNLSIEGVVRFGAQAVDNYISLWVGAFRAIVAVWENFPDALKNIFNRALDGAIRLVEIGINNIIAPINVVLDFVNLATIDPVALTTVENEYEGAGADLAAAIVGGFTSAFTDDAGPVETALDGLLTKAEEVAQNRLSEANATAPTLGTLATGADAATGPTADELIENDPYLQYLQSGAALYGQALVDRNQVQQEYDELLLQQAEDFADAKINLDQQILGSAVSTSSQLTSTIKNLAGENTTAYRLAFLAQQGFALATIALNTELAATAALAPPPIGLGPVAGAGYAAAIRTSGLISAGIVAAQTVAGIVNSYQPASTPSGGGSSGGTAPTAPTAPVSTPQQAPQQQIQVNINGSNLSQEELTQAMTDVFNSDAVVITQGQAQFQEINVNG